MNLIAINSPFVVAWSDPKFVSAQTQPSVHHKIHQNAHAAHPIAQAKKERFPPCSTAAILQSLAALALLCQSLFCPLARQAMVMRAMGVMQPLCSMSGSLLAWLFLSLIPRFYLCKANWLAILADGCMEKSKVRIARRATAIKRSCEATCALATPPCKAINQRLFRVDLGCN